MQNIENSGDEYDKNELNFMVCINHKKNSGIYSKVSSGNVRILSKDKCGKYSPYNFTFSSCLIQKTILDRFK